jgi:hypothetical protein
VRRGLASLILGLSLVVATVAWSGFVMLHTVLDPGRSERLADEMLSNAVLRAMVVDAVADSLAAAVPSGVEVPRQDLETAAATALDDPRAEALVRDGLVRIHRNALEGVDEPVTLDPAAFGAAARDALVQARPELAAVVPAAPSVPVTLPDARLGFIGGIRDLLERAVNTAAVVALGGAVVALVIARDRPGVLRRVSLWAFAASAFWLILGFGVPWLAERLAPASAAVFAAAVEVFLGAMIPPAIALAVTGVGLVGASFVWASLSRMGPASQGWDEGPAQRSMEPVAMPAQPGYAARPAVPAGAQAPTAPPRRQSAPAGADATSWLPADGPAPDPWDLTRPEPAPRQAAWLPPEDPWALTQPGPSPGPAPAGPRWVEGVGYVDD